jgi:hypothetical protein
VARGVNDRPRMPDLRSRIDLLLVDEDRAPVLTEVERMAASDPPAPEPRAKPDVLWADEHAPDDLMRQRWAVIAPAGEAGDRLIDAIAPLIDLRRREQGAVRVYRVPARMTLGEAARWKKRVFRTGADTEDELPRYQLIVGDLDEVPLAVQQTQATDGMVGRIAFDDLHGYRAYADKVVRWADRPAVAAAGDAILHAVRDGTPATRRGCDALIAPAHEILARRRTTGDVAYHALHLTGSERPSPDELWAVPMERPAVLLSLSHGVGVPRSRARQRECQGALSFGSGGAITGRDLVGRGFLPGGVWLAVACFAAGTPEASDYRHWLDVLARTGHAGSEIGRVLDTLAHERPFIAALPKAALSDPGGPLAFIGHVDLAWAYSFFDLDDQPRRRPGRLVSVVQALLNRHRAGVAVRKLMRAFAEVNTELTTMHDARARSGEAVIRDDARARRAHLWMLRQDLAGYVLLGDPAVRLPITGAAAEVDRAADAHAAEAAVLAMLAGAPLVEAAARHGLDGEALRPLAETYRAAGRAALIAALRSHRDRGP